MKARGNTIENKPFSVEDLDKNEAIKRGFSNLLTSFAIEGIHFSPQKIKELELKIHSKK